MRPKRRADMSVRERMAEEESAKAYWRKLHNGDRWTLGDQLVLGDMDYEYWFGGRPSSVFLDALDNERMNWEQTREIS